MTRHGVVFRMKQHGKNPFRESMYEDDLDICYTSSFQNTRPGFDWAGCWYARIYQKPSCAAVDGCMFTELYAGISEMNFSEAARWTSI